MISTAVINSLSAYKLALNAQNLLIKACLPVTGVVVKRYLTTSMPLGIKEISVVEEGNTKTISATIKDSSRVNNLLKFSEEGCPFCNVEKLGKKIHFTDVLILNQFLSSIGTLLPKRVTGLCRKQQYRLGVLVEQAKNAGLMPRHPQKWNKEEFLKQKQSNKLRFFNKYDENKERSIFSDFKSRLP